MLKYIPYYFIFLISYHNLLYAEKSLHPNDAPDASVLDESAPAASASEQSGSSKGLSQKGEKKTRVQRKIDKLNERLKKSPNDLNIHFLLGKYYYLSKDFNKAIFHLKKNKESPSIKGLILLSKIFDQQENHAEQIGILNTLLGKAS